MIKRLKLRRVETTQNSNLKTQNSRRERGQSLVEVALVLPMLVVLLSIVIEGGLALNAWIRVNTAARDATRFAADAARPDEVASLVLNKLGGIDFGSSREFTRSMELDVYIIKGTTGVTSTITTWNVDHRWDGNSGGVSETPVVQRSTIQTRLQSQGTTAARSIPFTIVEVQYNYTPLLATLFSGNAKLLMTSYALIQQY
jgi:hypothetical protein